MRRWLAVTALALPVLALETGSFERSLNVTGPVDLEVQNGSGGVTVRAGDASSVRISGSIRVNDASYRDAAAAVQEIIKNPPIVQTGNSVRVGPIQDEELRRHVAITYEITVPRQTRLRSRTGSGRQSVEGIQGPVDVSTGSGGINVSHVAAAVRAQTGSGHMELASIEGRLDAHTGSGGIDATAISGPINAQTGSGALRLEQTAAGTVDARTGSGGVTLRLPSNAGYDVDAHTGSGQVRVEPPITLQGSTNRHELRGQIRGGGTLVRVSTGSGGIRIE